MEFLVHNISHSDLVVELSWLSDEDGPSSPVDHDGAPPVPRSLLARPKFSLFQQISEEILNRVQGLHAVISPSTAAAACGIESAPPESPEQRPSQPPPVLHPSLLDIAPEKSKSRAGRVFRWKAKCQATQSPIGFNLEQCPVLVTALHDFQLRGGVETLQLVQKHWTRVAITAVYFPLIALLLPKWLQVLKEFKSDGSQKLVYLISGAGIPRNVSHSIHGNSTEITAKLISLFVQQYYPQMEAKQVHSGSNIFRFDDNVQFMTRELRPRLEAHRETLVDRCGEGWKAHFHVTIAYTDGPPARLSALNASLRIYEPSYLHIWQLKTFWHERKLSMADVDFHSFENIEASPTIAYAQADAMTQLLIKEMRTFRDQFLDGQDESEVTSFWLRKSKKPVLAVLLVEKTDQDGSTRLVVHRGMNCEVSMPTGSLCAERNAIGSALAQDPTLKRRALKMIGVLGLDTPSTNSAGGPAPNVSQITSSPSSAPSKAASSNNEVPPNSAAAPAPAGASGTSPRKKRPQAETAVLRKPKRPRTFSCDDASVESLFVSDRNPLAPCGACKEWLVKIAEANPSFKVVTFENARCRNFYVKQLM